MTGWFEEIKQRQEQRQQQRKERTRQLKGNRRTKTGRKLERENARARTRVWSEEEKADRKKIRDRWNILCDQRSDQVASFDHTRNDLRCNPLDSSMKKGMRIQRLNIAKPRYRLYFGNDCNPVGWRYCYCCHVSPLEHKCCQPCFD